MKLRSFWLPAIIAMCLVAFPLQALDRDAFTFTHYDLKLTIDPAKGTLSASGTIKLRNDSAAAQSNVPLQISSSLHWTSITLGRAEVPYLSQPYTSDIDHTGALSEAIVTLPEAVAPKASISLNVAYEGPVPRDATRLTRIGTPEQLAVRSDWDQITADFSAVRGTGYVTWFPVSITAVSLGEGDSTFNALATWRDRHSDTRMDAAVSVIEPAAPTPRVTVRLNTGNSGSCDAPPGAACTSAVYRGFRDVPSFAIANFDRLERPAVDISFLPEHSSFARDFAASIERIEPAIADWLGAQREKLQIIELADPDAAPFETGVFLFTPFARTDPRRLDVVTAHQVAHSHFSSPRPWIDEGIAHLMQILVLERQSGRRAAIAAISRYYPQLVEAETAVANPSKPGEPVPKGEPLITTNDPFFYRSKALAVWYMLRDMVGDDALRSALQAYRAEQDKQPAYMQGLLEKAGSPGAPPRNLEWFFDDWVYRDRGVPDFVVDSAYPRKTLNGTYVVTVTVENRGRAAAEVPVLVSSAAGERSARTVVQAGGKGIIRVAFPAVPTRAVVNDGSVPEISMDDNAFNIPEPRTE